MANTFRESALRLSDPECRVATRAQLVDLLRIAQENLTVASSSPFWRQLYTDACLCISLSDILAPPNEPHEKVFLECIALLDRAIIIAGAAGQDRLELILDVIAKIQSQFLPQRTFVVSDISASVQLSRSVQLETAMLQIPCLSTTPSLMAFQRQFSSHPFILRGYLLDWPAMNEHPWMSLDYLRYIAGPGRIVPVEVGSDYRKDDWSQELMNWDDFIEGLATGKAPDAIRYLAQHDLLTQFPQLRADITIPDYAYASLSPPSYFPEYTPPGNDEQLVINAWLGPKGTVSPAHTVSLSIPFHVLVITLSHIRRRRKDPYFNLFGE